MGTGSFGGGSSGALGRSGSGARFAVGTASSSRAGTTGQEFFASRGQDGIGSPSIASAGALVRETFAQRGVGDYMVKMVSSPAVRGCFEELFIVGVLLTQQQSWEAIERKYAVRDGAGCLANLATAIKRKHVGEDTIEAFREIAATSVDDVLLAAVGEEDDVYLDGRADDVFSAIRKSGAKVFASLSGYFFGSVLYRAAVRELPALNEREKEKLRHATQERADFIIAKFGHAFAGKGQTTHRQLLKTFSEHQDWFRDKLREDMNS